MRWFTVNPGMELLFKQQKERKLTPVATWWALKISLNDNGSLPKDSKMIRKWQQRSYFQTGNTIRTPLQAILSGIVPKWGMPPWYHQFWTISGHPMLRPICDDVSSKMTMHWIHGFHHFLRHASAVENRVAWRCARVGPHCSSYQIIPSSYETSPRNHGSARDLHWSMVRKYLEPYHTMGLFNIRRDGIISSPLLPNSGIWAVWMARDEIQATTW